MSAQEKRIKYGNEDLKCFIRQEKIEKEDNCIHERSKRRESRKKSQIF